MSQPNMVETSQAAPFSSEARASYYFFSLYGFSGVAAAYLPIWLVEKGLSETEIGWLNALPIFCMLLINIYVGRVADRAKDWRGVVVIGSLVSAVASLGLLLVWNFYALLVVWTLCMVPIFVILPVVDAATMRMARRRGRVDFSSIRAWGTIGNGIATAITGFCVSIFGAALFVPLLVGSAIVRGLVSLQLPRFRAPSIQTETAAARASQIASVADLDGTRAKANSNNSPKIAHRLSAVTTSWLVVPIIAGGLLTASHAILMAFAALFWRAAGIDMAMIGLLFAAGTAAEAILMFSFKRVSRRFSARHLILIAALVSAFRWAMLALEPELPVLFLLQLLHGITFTFMYLGVVNFVTNWTSDSIAASAQSFFMVVQQSLTVVALLGFGYLAQQVGVQAFVLSSAMALISAGAVFISLRLMPTHREQKTAP